jgi:hypothetical protein
MAAIPVQKFNVTTGAKPTFNPAAASATAEIGTGKNRFLVAKNTAGTTVTMALTVVGNNSYGQPNPDPSYTLAITTGEVWVPLLSDFNDGTGSVTVTFSGTTIANTTVALVER